jgi:uncharacterized protein YxeA
MIFLLKTLLYVIVIIIITLVFIRTIILGRARLNTLFIRRDSNDWNTRESRVNIYITDV